MKHSMTTIALILPAADDTDGNLDKAMLRHCTVQPTKQPICILPNADLNLGNGNKYRLGIWCIHRQAVKGGLTTYQ